MSNQLIDEIKCPEVECFMNESSSDVVFIVEGQRVPAIKHYLLVKNRVFRAMFSGNFNESKVTEVVIEDTTYEAFKTIIQFLYCDQLVLKDDNDYQLISDVCQLCDRYEVLRLMDRICDHLKNRIDNKNLTSISKIVFNFKIEELIENVIEYIDRNICSVIKMDVQELKELNVITQNKLLDLLTTRNLQTYYPLQDNKVIIRVDVQGQILNVLGYLIENKAVLTLICGKNKLDPYMKTYLIVETTFEGFKTLLGFLYFDQLILKDENDLALIGEVCAANRNYNKFFGHLQLLDKIGEHLRQRISFENLKIISKIAFDYEIEELIVVIKDFIKQNLKKLIQQDNSSLIKINDSTKNILLEVMVDLLRELSHKQETDI